LNKLDLTLVNETIPFQPSKDSPTEASTDGGLVIYNNYQLADFTNKFQTSIQWKYIRSMLDGILWSCLSYFTEPSGSVPNNFPIFSYAGYSSIDLPIKIKIKQDEVKSKELAEFLHIFKHINHHSINKIEFEYKNREEAINLLSNVQSLISVSEFFGDRHEQINMPKPEVNHSNAISNLMTENHNAGRVTSEEYVTFGIELLSAKHYKFHEHPDIAETYIRKVIKKVQEKQYNSKRKEVEYLNSIIISLKLDLAFVMDRAAANEVMDAMALARQIDDKVLIANCQRFATQCLDMSSEAIAMLESSCNLLREFPESSEENGHILPCLFGSISNRNTTKLVLNKTLIDPKSMENDFWEAKSRLPMYQNMALLGNAAAVAYMVFGNFKDAERILNLCINENAEHTDRLNMYCNLLVAQYLGAKSYNSEIFCRLIDQLNQYEKGANWEYLKVRMSLNLMRISTLNEHFVMARDVSARSPFWGDYDHTISLDDRFDFFLKKRFPYYFEGNRMKGGIGEFVSFYKIFPSIDKDYT